MENVYHVGMDVHKETVELSIFRNWDNKPLFEKRVPNCMEKILPILERLERDGRVTSCYEAGCMGFTLQRDLARMGIACQVVAPGKLPRRPTDRVKTDRRDARNLARLMRAGEAPAIHVPDEEDESVRDYLRARDDLQGDVKRAKQRLLKFLLRLGHRYETPRHWTQRHRAWLKSIQFTHETQKETFNVYYARVIDLEGRLCDMDRRIEEMARSERYRSMVDRLRCLRGVDYLTSMAFICEIGDFRRFPSAESFMAYLGLVPGEHSSGEKRHQGGITKSGNSHLRRLLIESGWHYRHQPVPGKRLRSRRAGQAPEIIAYADRAARRLNKKFTRLVFKGKPRQVAVTAVARELAGFIWGLMTDSIA